MEIDIKRVRLGDILVARGLISESDLSAALEIQRVSGKRLGQVLIKEALVTEEQIMRALEFQLGIKGIDLSKFYIEPEAVKLLPESLCRKYLLLGIQVSNGELMLAMKDPLDYYALEDVRLIVKLPIKQVIASEKDLLHAIERFYNRSIAEKAVEDFVKQYNIETLSQDHFEKVDKKDELKNAPMVRFINSVIDNAIQNNASDIHVEPEEDEIRIRIRIDGILHETMVIGIETLNAIVSRIKIMSNLNIAEKRLPQDGRIGYAFEGKSIDLRVSILPTTYGEKVVMRILDRSKFFISKEMLGFHEDEVIKFERIINKPNGILLVTGPTGSGKTSTLYAAMSELNDVKKNIITLEDPVEYDLKGVNQVQLNVKAGLTFASGLRSILRQDPDIIMVGEVRDSETAEIAIRSALTGHLVLSTLHTNDAPGAITRIIDMGVEPFLISSTFIGIIAQRLVRKVCNTCKIEYKPDDREMGILGNIGLNTSYAYKGTGCNDCQQTGYQGRVAVFEIMEIDKAIRTLIDRSATTDEIRDKAISRGMSTLKKSCGRLVLNGITTVDELVRVTYNY